MSSTEQHEAQVGKLHFLMKNAWGCCMLNCQNIKWRAGKFAHLWVHFRAALSSIDFKCCKEIKNQERWSHFKVKMFLCSDTMSRWPLDISCCGFRFVNLLLSQMSVEELREEACDCLFEIVNKGMDPVDKTKLVESLCQVLQSAGFFNIEQVGLCNHNTSVMPQHLPVSIVVRIESISNVPGSQ